MAQVTVSPGIKSVDAAPAPAVTAPPWPMHPPPARLALRVGIVGHRLNRLETAYLAGLETAVAAVLTDLRRIAEAVHTRAGESYRPEPPVLRLVSSLAEGTDRIGAHLALAQGYELMAPLPFTVEVYEEDFGEAASRAEYRALLDQASSVLEMDGSRATAQQTNEAYEAAGRLLLNQCDVLIAVWDGQDAQGRGGTGQIVAEAFGRDIPVVWIGPEPPFRTCIILRDSIGGRAEAALDELRPRLMSLLLPPPAAASEGEERPDLRHTYFSERQPRWAIQGWVWRFFRDLIADGKFHAPRFRVADYERRTAAEWSVEWQVAPSLDPGVVRLIDGHVRPHYSWADNLAIYYADMFRSSFIVNYLLGVLSVLLVIIAYAAGWTESTQSVDFLKNAGTLAIILFVLFNTWSIIRRRWRERSIDYRLLAEMLRQLRFLAPLGRIPPLSRPPAHQLDGDPRSTWMGWHVRAVAREMRLPSTRFDDAYLENCRKLLHDGLIVGNGEVYGQVEYHAGNADRLDRLDRHLKAASVPIYAATPLTLIILFFITSPPPWLGLIAAVFPALGTAIAAIGTQLELGRLIKRSRSMAKQLERIAVEMTPRTPPLSSAALGTAAEAAADAMIGEVLDWRVVFEVKSLNLTG